MKIITDKISLYRNSFDPTNEYFINALKMTAPMTAGVIFWICSRRPCSWMIFLPPGFMIIASLGFSEFKGKLLALFLVTLNVEIAQLLVSIFINHKIVLLIFLFIQIMIAYSAMKYRIVATASGFLIAVSLSSSNSWYDGVDRSMDLLIAFIFSALTVVLFDYIFSRFLIRSTLKHISSLVNDAFFVYTEEDRIKIKNSIDNRYLFERSYLRRADLFVEETLDNKSDIFLHKVTIGLNKAEKMFSNKNFIFGKNKISAFHARKIYYQYRRIFRSINFLLYYKNNSPFFKKNLPCTENIIKTINDELYELNNFIKLGKYNSSDSFIQSTAIWHKQLAKLELNHKEIKNIEHEKFIYGINQVLKEITKLKLMCKLKRYNKLFI